ncbi:MAG: plastocyanin/azurin family copper-binding protein [Dehalococcoidales bacterium]|nr:plastocyanin/azurin family copper-binding protein [Dehalococcoidales bacterium]
MKNLVLLALLMGIMLSLVSCYPFGSDGSWDKEEKPPVQTTPAATGPAVVTVNGTAYAFNIDGFAFTPTILIVNKGTTVTWTNKYPIAHRVVADKDEFASGVLGTGLSFSWTFSESGNYTYYCANHPTMNGMVVVK